jgi:hypothetical protein
MTRRECRFIEKVDEKADEKVDEKEVGKVKSGGECV